MMVPSQKEDGQDALLQAKDYLIRAMEKELHRTIEGKDDLIRAMEKDLHRTIEGKNEVIRAKNDLVRAKDDLLREVRSKLAETTAMLWHIEGKLNLRNTIEKFEDRAPPKWESELARSLRAKKWSAMLKANTDNIAVLLLEEDRQMTDDEVSRWVRAAQDLYNALSASVHTSRDMKIVINAARLNPDPLKLAVCTARATPIPYSVENELDVATSIGGRKDSGDGASGSVDVAGITKEMSECSTDG